MRLFNKFRFQNRTNCVVNVLRFLLMITTLIIQNIGIADTVEEIHFLIPGGAGGGWDGTGRGVAEALLLSQSLAKGMSVENMSGNGGGKAIRFLMEEAADSPVVMVNSTPIILRNLVGVFPESFRDLTPLACLIGDYGALVVRNESKIKNFSDLVAEFEADPTKLKVAGGSLAGGMDHLVMALALKSAGADPKDLVYVPYDGGGNAMKSLLFGETQILSTGLSEALALAAQGNVRVLVTTAPDKINDLPSLRSEGYPADFVNWRGLFGPPNLSVTRQEKLHKVLEKMYQTEVWERIREKNAWTNLFIPGSDFTDFLGVQELQIQALLAELGFL
mgnify:CR=1 FL=1